MMLLPLHGLAAKLDTLSTHAPPRRRAAPPSFAANVQCILRASNFRRARVCPPPASAAAAPEHAADGGDAAAAPVRAADGGDAASPPVRAADGADAAAAPRRPSGPRHGRDMRLCVATRERKHRDLMWRVCRIAPGRVALDNGQGRSAYVSRTLDAVLAVRRKDRLGRSLRAKVPSEIYDELERRAREQDLT